MANTNNGGKIKILTSGRFEVIDLETILILVSESLQMRPEQIASKSQRNDICDARSLFIFFACKAGYGRQEIIDEVKLSSKSAINYHIARVEDLVTRDRAMRGAYGKCSARIKAYRESQLNPSQK